MKTKWEGIKSFLELWLRTQTELLYETAEIPLLCERTGFRFGFIISHTLKEDFLFAASLISPHGKEVSRLPSGGGYRSAKSHGRFVDFNLASNSRNVGNWRLEILEPGGEKVSSINFHIREATETDRRSLGWGDSKAYYQGRTVEEWECSLRDQVAEVQTRAFDLLAQYGPKSIPIILKAWNEKDARFAALAKTAFERIGPSARQAIPRALETLQDPKMADAARVAAAEVVQKIGPPGRDQVPSLIDILKNAKFVVVREAVARGLAKLGPEAKDAIPALTEASKKCDLAAKYALRRIKFPNSPPGPCKEEFLGDCDAGGWAASFAMTRGDLRPCPKEGDEEKKVAADRTNVAFTRRHGVQETVACGALSRDPFAYEGKVVLVHSIFERVVSRDQAILGTFNTYRGPLPLIGCDIVVSGVPHGAFPSAQVAVILAGRVLGNIEVKIGPVTLQVPHLQYVGVHICKEKACADFFGPESMR